MPSEASLANLKGHEYKPGQSGNPSGRNGWTVMRERYRHLLDSQHKDTQGQTVMDALADKLIRVALRGDVVALKALLAPVIDTKRLELTGNDGAPIDFASLAEKANGSAHKGEPHGTDTA